MSVKPLRPLPVGMTEYNMTIVLNDHVCGDDAYIVLAMINHDIAHRIVKHTHEQDTTTIYLHFGAYDDTVAHLAAASLVQKLHAMSKVQGVILRSGARIIVAAHEYLR